MTVPSLPTGLIDFLIHPPLGILKASLDYLGPYSGYETIDHFSSTPGPIYTNVNLRDTFGVLVDLNGALPPKWGRDYGWVSLDGQVDATTYRPPLAQLVVQHQLQYPSGPWVISQVADVEMLPTMVMWTEALPGRLGLKVMPGLQMDLYYMTIWDPS